VEGHFGLEDNPGTFRPSGDQCFRNNGRTVQFLAQIQNQDGKPADRAVLRNFPFLFDSSRDLFPFELASHWLMRTTFYSELPWLRLSDNCVYLHLHFHPQRDRKYL